LVFKGDTNIKYLLENDCNIWTGDAFRNYISTYKGNFELDKEEFINAIKTSPEFAKKWGELGPIYGAGWRRWDVPKILTIEKGKVENGIGTEWGSWERNPIDQIANLINELKTNPDSRRLMVSAWNVGEIDSMVLPPCHFSFQCYTRELSLEERATIWDNTHNPVGNIYTHNQYDENDIPARAISLMWNQRSVDTFLGLPFNIASYGLLLEIIAKEVNMVPDELIGNLGDTHLYLNHIEQAKEQIGRKYTPEERETMLKDAMSWRFYNKAVNELMPFGGGMSEYYEAHKIPYYTREPFPLPILKILHNPCKDVLPTDISCYNVFDFELENYQSHPTIKAPLSN
jgi:thymidylate synthase